jgi:fatty-acyl-CoA synthase
MINIATWIQRNALIYRDKTALKDERWTLSYRQLNERVSRLAAALQAQGMGPGDRVALLLPNCTEMVEVLFAVARLGAIYVPLNWRLGEEEQAFILNDCTPSAFVYDAQWRERAQALGERLSFFPLEVGEEKEGSPYEKAIANHDPLTEEPLPTGDDDDLMIIYTSGTTGDPKGVVLTHNNVFWQTINGWSLGVSPDTVCLVLLPMFHVGGLNGSVTPMLHVGATVLLQRGFDAKTVLSTIEEQGVTGVVGVPTIFRLLADQPEFATTDLSRCQVLLSGGAPLPESLIQLYHKRGLEFRQGYGLTEACPGVTGMGPGECLNKAGSAGRQIPYTEVRIAESNDNPVPPGESGEILVRGPNVMKGYWKRPAETEETLRGGWLHTGDIGRFDEDGFLYLVDRKKDMLISGGENVYPAEIEKCLAGHPAVQQVTVVGRSDDKWGEIPVAVVVARTPDVEAEQLRAFLLDRLAKYKVPREFHFVESLPLNAAGKVIKAEVRTQLQRS